MVDALLQDIRYAARLFRRNPLFTLAASSSLALGIGMNAAVFSVAQAALLRSWPAKEPERLVRIAATTPQSRDSSFSYPDYQDLAGATQALQGVLAYSRHAKTLRIGPESEWVLDDLVSPNYFDVLGIRAARGRTFTAGSIAGEPVVVISDALWRRAFNSDPALVGQTIVLTGRSYTVLGIGPPGFRGLERAVQQMLGFLPRTSPTRRAWQIGVSAVSSCLAVCGQARLPLKRGPNWKQSVAVSRTLTRRSTARDA
jgi:hypothetical protein